MSSRMGVLITYFNERELLCDCLESIRLQTVLPDEIIVYDDCSQFPARDYLPRDFPLNIQIIRGESNRGPAYGRNMLLRASESDFIHFHDSDDIFRPQWCEHVRRVIETEKADFLIVDVSSTEDDGSFCDNVMGLQDTTSTGDFISFCIRRVILTIAGVYRRSSVLNIGGYREALVYSEDYDFHVRLAASGARSALIAEPLILIRNRELGRTKKNMVATFWGGIEAIRVLLQELPAKYHPDFAETTAWIGYWLCKLGAWRQAKEAFRLAHTLGPPTFSDPVFRDSYRMMAKVCGPMVVERIASIYRWVLPEGVRARLIEKGS